MQFTYNTPLLANVQHLGCLNEGCVRYTLYLFLAPYLSSYNRTLNCPRIRKYNEIAFKNLEDLIIVILMVVYKVCASKHSIILSVSQIGPRITK